MTKIDIPLKKNKRDRLKINNTDDLKEALRKEGYCIDNLNKNTLREYIDEQFKINNEVLDMLYKCINEDDIIYSADDIDDFIDYIKKIVLFEEAHNKLCRKISKINKLIINRIEYDRIMTTQDNVDDIIKEIEEMKKGISLVNVKEEISKIKELEKEINEKYLYAKDIELLKQMIIFNNDNIQEDYDENTRTKTLYIEIPEDINNKYIKPKRGSIEYHEHLTRSIPRMHRLIKNIHKYVDNDAYIINQSKALQDSINIALVTYDNKEFKAISGSDEIEDYCITPKNPVFVSCKVNKLGKLGIGYKRKFDSEKKILEEIHKQIEEKRLKEDGNLILYSRWEPCPSCYFVISQFLKIHPNVKVEIVYNKSYGEK